jgi:hypothetical protein
MSFMSLIIKNDAFSIAKRVTLKPLSPLTDIDIKLFFASEIRVREFLVTLKMPLHKNYVTSSSSYPYPTNWGRYNMFFIMLC